jgi:hypothetical protein
MSLNARCIAVQGLGFNSNLAVAVQGFVNLVVDGEGYQANSVYKYKDKLNNERNVDVNLYMDIKFKPNAILNRSSTNTMRLQVLNSSSEFDPNKELREASDALLMLAIQELVE